MNRGRLIPIFLIFFLLRPVESGVTPQCKKAEKDSNDYCKGKDSFSNAIKTCHQLNMDLVGDHSQLTSLAKSNNISEVWLPLLRNRTTDSAEEKYAFVDNQEVYTNGEPYNKLPVLCQNKNCTLCPSGQTGTLCSVHNNTCFFTFALKASWYKAEALCRSFNYSLISVKQMKHIKEQKTFWLDKRGEDWVNKSANPKHTLDIYWSSNEPSGLKNGSCSVLRQSLWYVKQCDQSRVFFCTTKHQADNSSTKAPKVDKEHNESKKQDPEGNQCKLDTTMIAVFAVFITLMLIILGVLLWTMKKNNERLAQYEYLVHYRNNEEAATDPAPSDSTPDTAPAAAPERVCRAADPPPKPDRMAVRPPPPLPDNCSSEPSTPNWDRIKKRRPPPTPSKCQVGYYQCPRGTSAANPHDSIIVTEENPLYES